MPANRKLIEARAPARSDQGGAGQESGSQEGGSRVANVVQMVGADDAGQVKDLAGKIEARK